MNNVELFATIKDGLHAEVDAYFSKFPELVNVKNMQATVEDSKVWNELTPIHCAAKYGHLAIVRRLVELGAEVYSNPYSTYPAVIVANWEERTEVVDYFLKEIPHLAAGTNGLGVMCNLAGREGWIDIVKKHIEFDPGVVLQRGWIGDTPLHWPAHNGFIDIVRLLLDAGADPNSEENNWIGGTPLHWASERHSDIIGLLVKHGANLDALVTRPNSHHLGATPLIWCAKQRDDCAEAAQTLLDLGANPYIKDPEGKTAREHAEVMGHAKVAQCLKSF